jgi:hypothetical protein
MHELLPSGYRQVFGVVCTAGSRVPSFHEKAKCTGHLSSISVIALVEDSTMMTNTNNN